jgi:hypothetical protein
MGHQAFTGPRASPLIDARYGHPLLHIQLEPWVPPGAFFVGCLVPGTRGVWLVDSVLPMGLQIPSAPSVIPLTPPLRPHAQSEGWLQAFTSLLVRVWKSLSGDSYIRLLSEITSWHRNCVWVWWLHMGWISKWGSLWMAVLSVPAPLFVLVFPLDNRNSGLIILRWVGGPIPQSATVPNI